MAQPLSIEALRRELGLNQTEFAVRLGLANKASVSLIERGGPCSLSVALAIESLSGGRIDAAALNADVALSRQPILAADNDRRTPAATSAIDDEPAAPVGDWQLTDAELDQIQDAPARVIICDVCEARLDRDVAPSCTFVDCPHAVRNAA